METDFAVLLGAVVFWLAAGLLADGLSAAPTAARLRRRAGALLIFSWAGLLSAGAVAGIALSGDGSGPVDKAGSALLLPAVPAVVVAVRTMRRLRRLRAGAGAFSTAPDIPVPPALRAAAAHPLVVLPLQLTGLMALPAIGAATGTVVEAAPLAGPGLAGLALTAVALVAVTTGVRHGLRHSRLAERSVTLRPPASRADRLQQV